MPFDFPRPPEHPQASPIPRDEVLGRVRVRLAAVVQTLAGKQGEYSHPDNGFHNFDRAAAALGQTPEMVLVGFAAKHLVSVLDIVDGLEGGRVPTPALWNEKAGDFIAYLALLDAMMQTRRLKQEPVRA